MMQPPAAVNSEADQFANQQKMAVPDIQDEEDFEQAGNRELFVDDTVLQNFNKSRYLSKLEKLLAQPDIFDTLRKIEAGQIKSYDELDINAQQKYDRQQQQKAMRRAAGEDVRSEEAEEDF